METIKVKAQVASLRLDESGQQFTQFALDQIANAAVGKEIFMQFDATRPCGEILLAVRDGDKVTVEAELRGVAAIAAARLAEECAEKGENDRVFIVPGFRSMVTHSTNQDARVPMLIKIQALELICFGLVTRPMDRSLESVQNITNSITTP